MTANPFQKATRAQLKARVALEGPTGAGKTWTGLEWATVLADGGRVAVVDTERGSASLYSDHFDFDVVTFEPPYEPARLTEILKAAESHGYAVVVIDSLSHFWEGEGGTLDMVDAAAARSRSGNKFSEGWKVATPALRHLVDTMLGLDAHLIATMRSKMEYILVENDRGQKVPTKVGMAPVMRAGVEYEFTLVGDMDLDHRLTITKSRCDLLADQVIQPKRAGEAAHSFMAWLGQGEPLADRETVESLKERMNALPKEMGARGAFKAALGHPDHLRESQLAEAESLVARFEGRGGGGGDEPVEGSAAAPPPPENENPTQKGGGDDDSAGKGSPGAQPAASGPGERSSEAESEPPPAPVGAGEAAASSAPSGVTAEQLLELAEGRTPAARKGRIQRTGVAVAQALGLTVPTSFDEVLADQVLAAAVLADLRGDDKPPPPSGGGQDPAVGEQPPAQAPESGPAPAVPAPTAVPDQEPVALKTQNASDWRKENARCQALAAEHLSGDPETLKSQREALAYQASGGRVTSWSEVTRTEFSLIRSWLEFIANGHGRVVESDAPLHFGWQVVIEEAA